MRYSMGRRHRRVSAAGDLEWDYTERNLLKSIMPKRTDISSILVIGAGPIVIGQACEFDYSGTQAIKALKEEGYRIVLVNSNPATIMTDPDLADATYIEPITPAIVAKIIEKERPDARAADDGRADRAQHRAGAVQRRHAGEVRRPDDRRRCRGDRQGRGPAEVQGRDDQDRARKRALGDRAYRRPRRWRGWRRSGCRRSSAPASRSAGPAAASPTTATSSSTSCARGSTPRRPPKC